MLKTTAIPSRLLDSVQRKPVQIRPVTKPSKFGLLVFGRHFLRWAGHLIQLFLQRRLSSAVFALSVKDLFEEMGGLWIKVGQLLSLRVDLFPLELCQELSKLQGQVAGFSTDIARSILERELGGPIARFFDEFEEAPFAAASIGQIHRARLRDEGVWVAVKIQRPYLAETFARDLAIIKWLMRILRLLSVYPFMRWDMALRELGEIVREELDCRYEASAYTRMKNSLKDHGIYVPKVFSEYTTQYVLVTEFVHAVLMADYIQMATDDPGGLQMWLQENNVDPKKVAVLLMESAFRQTFEDNLYHGDMHPGNILLLRDSHVALIDFGAVAFTELEYLQKCRLFVKALINGDYAKAADTAFLLCGTLPKIDLEEVKEDLIEVLRAWGGRSLVTALPYREKSMDNAFVLVAKVLFRHGLAMQWALLRVRRATATLEASIISLYPDVDTGKQYRRSLRRAQRRQLRTIAGKELFPRLAKGLADAIEVAESAYEQALYQGSLMRRQAQVFEGTTNKFAYLVSEFYRQFSAVQLIAGVLFIGVFLFQHYPGALKPWIGPQVIRVLKLFPFLDYQVWLLIIALDFFLLGTSLRLSRVFAAREVGNGNRYAT